MGRYVKIGAWHARLRRKRRSLRRPYNSRIPYRRWPTSCPRGVGIFVVGRRHRPGAKHTHGKRRDRNKRLHTNVRPVFRRLHQKRVHHTSHIADSHVGGHYQRHDILCVERGNQRMGKHQSKGLSQRGGRDNAQRQLQRNGRRHSGV